MQMAFELSTQLSKLPRSSDRSLPGLEGGTVVIIRKGVPHDHVDLPPFVSIEAKGVCTPTGNSQMLLAAVYRPPGRAWIDPNVTDLLSFRTKSLLVGDLNAKNPIWNSQVSNLQARNSWTYLIIITFKFQCLILPSTIRHKDMAVYLILWSFKMSIYQM